MERTVNFGDSLSDILNRRSLCVKDLASDINISLATVYSWLRNATEPHLSSIVKMADRFNCSIEYLIGRSDDETFRTSKVRPPLTTAIREVMRENGVSSYKLRKISKYDGAYFYNWEHGNEPKLSTLVELSNVLECTIDYLIGRV